MTISHVSGHRTSVANNVAKYVKVFITFDVPSFSLGDNYHAANTSEF